MTGQLRFVRCGGLLVMRAGELALERAVLVCGPVRVTARVNEGDGWYTYDRIIGPNHFYRKRRPRSMRGK